MLSGSLTAEPDRFSDDAWDLLLAAQETARRWRHGAMDVEHLLQALLLERRFAGWVEQLPINADRVLDAVEAFCQQQLAGGDGQLFIGDALEDLLEQADRSRAAWGSRLIDLPHVLLALLEEPRIGGSALAAEGLSEEQVRRWLRPGATAAPDPQRESQRDDWVDTTVPARGNTRGPIADDALVAAPLPPQFGGSEAEPEPTALERYGRDLTAAARAGELDPVIGRDTEIRRLIQVLSRRG